MKIDDLKNIPNYQKAIAISVLVVVLVVLFYWFMYLPKKTEIVALNSQISKVQNEININKTKARRLEELKIENELLQRQLTAKKQELPSAAEVESLLKQVSELGLLVGLDFKLWRPAARKIDPSNLYMEIPVNVSISGDYHTVAIFFDRVGKLPRIVNIQNISFSNPKPQKDKVLLSAKFVSTAFASYDPPPVKEKPKGAKKKTVKKRKKKKGKH